MIPRNANVKSHRPDYRTRRDRTQRHTEAFNRQMPALMKAYLDLHLSVSNAASGNCGFFVHHNKASKENTPEINGSTQIKVVDVFCIIPSLPISLTTGLTVQALELYRIAHQQNPHFSIQAYIKTLCDLQGVQFYAYLSHQFSIALDIYLQILASVNMLVYEVLLRGDPHWRLKHACPACMYKLQGEVPMKFSLLYAMDGNDSLKQVLKKSTQDNLDTNSPFPQRSSELPTTQFVSGDCYLSNNYSEQFARDSPTDMLSLDDDEDNPCAGHWKNMQDEKMKKMWGIFNELGIFMSICRHGFSLLIANMVQSGEQAKYPLAIISKLLNTFSSNLGGGYDIGCHFKTTLSHSSLGQCACKLNHTLLVGASHGHAHQCLCQLNHLATYSNALASSVRYVSVFHQCQAITHYFEHNDDYEVYVNLSTFLYNNYKQALHIISDGTNSLPKLMHELGLEDESVFDTWLAEEHTYLTLLCHEPNLEMIQMEYWQKLVNLSGSKKDLDAATAAWTVTMPSTVEFGACDIASMNRMETTRRHAMENYEKDLKAVQELEMKLGMTCRWEQEDQEWKDMGHLVANQKFQHALDHLEGLVVAQVFELSKMNQAGTGYKLRKHIGKALQVRSAAIQTALDRYNTAARALRPPCASLSWEEVVEYTFLSNFDLLHDAHCKKQLQTLHPRLAHQVSLHHKICAHFAGHHHQRLYDISMLEGFTGSIMLGESVE
ncbi:hypothetical protein BDR05DRAFT_976169 [Suillus weaverae]|nr:hypothetical protein BDR05DRAFT_976169 [Suillus weaverae]